MNLILIQSISTFLLTGLIWVIQCVHYPFFSFIDKQLFEASMKFHQFRISLIVIPLMLIELVSALVLAVIQWDFFPMTHFINLSLLLVIWAHTFFIMVPFHSKFQLNNSRSLLQKMLNVHWVRTFTWTLKSLLWALVLWHII